MRLKGIVIASVCLTLFSCSGMQRSESEKIRRKNAKKEMIYRNEKDVFHPICTPKLSAKPSYPWQSELQIPKITKEYFRCKGSLTNPAYVDMVAGQDEVTYCDCNGGGSHGLPVIHGKEGVYPVLLDLLNYVQKKTSKKVIITSGHRCPEHNKYVDCSKENRVSKYQIGAACDFYVQGLEESPMQIVEIIMQYYLENPQYQNQKEYLTFTRYDKPDSFVSTHPWMNKEIYIKLSLKDEGRNFDNQHQFPYLTLQVRYDSLKQEKVVYDWNKAQNGYLKKH